MMNIQAPGAIWEGWVVTEQLGRDHLGPVYRAMAMDGTQRSTVKHIALEANTPDFDACRERLSEAIGTMMQLSGTPGFVPVEDSRFDFREDGTGVDVFIRTPGLPGLTEYLSGMGQPDQPRVLAIGIDIARAIDTLQQMDMVHRNLKPAAIFWDEGSHSFRLGNLWNVCSLKDEAVAVTGTPNFMPPEVYNRQAVTSRTMDLYALGTVLYRLMNGNRVPFLSYGMQPEQALAIRMNGTPVPAPSDADPRLAAVLQKCLAPSPADRYQTGAELAKALNACYPATGVNIDPQPPVKPEESVKPHGFRNFRTTRK